MIKGKNISKQINQSQDIGLKGTWTTSTELGSTAVSVLVALPPWFILLKIASCSVVIQNIN